MEEVQDGGGNEVLMVRVTSEMYCDRTPAWSHCGSTEDYWNGATERSNQLL